MPITCSAIIHKEGDIYVAQYPEIGTASQGVTIEEALANLQEATELYLEEFVQHIKPQARQIKDRQSPPGVQ